MASRRSLFVMLTSFSSTLMTSWMMSSMSSMMVTITKITLFNQKYPLSQIMLHHDQHDQHKTQVILLLQCLSPRSSSSHSSSMTIVNSKILSMDGDYRSSFLSSVFSHHHQVFQDQKLSMVFTNGNNSASCQITKCLCVNYVPFLLKLQMKTALAKSLSENDSYQFL